MKRFYVSIFSICGCPQYIVQIDFSFISVFSKYTILCGLGSENKP